MAVSFTNKKKKVGKAEATVSIIQPDGSEEELHFIPEVGQVEGHPAHVEFSVGKTVNLGKYNSGKVHVSITLPCTNNQASLDAAVQFGIQWCESTLGAKLEEYGWLPEDVD